MDILNFSGRKRLSIVRQTEATECGLACLVMISNFYGHDVDLGGLRAKYPISLRGLTLETLLDLSAKLHLDSRPLRLELENLENLQLPAILHWDMNHFVVLKSMNGSECTIFDPARGIRKLKLNEVSSHFTGIGIEFFPAKKFEKIEERKKMPLSSLWGRMIGVKRSIFQILLLSIILQFIVLLSPFYLQLVVDEALVKFDKQLLLILAVGFGFLAMLNSLTTMMRSWTILYFGNQLSFQMVANVFRHLVHLPITYYEKRHIGDIISRVRSTKPLQVALSQSLVSVIIDGIMAVITGIVIFSYSVTLGVIVLVSVTLMVVSTILYYPVLHQLQEEAILTDAKKDSHEIETIRSATAIKLFTAQNLRMASWRNLFAESINASVIYGKHQIFHTTIQTVISGLQTIAVVYFGALLILADTRAFTVGMLFAFMSYRQSFTQSVTALLEKFIEFRLLSLHLERLADITQSEAENISSGVGEVDIASHSSRIDVKDLWFRYSESDPWVLKGVSFTIAAGEFVSITGVSGGGKTTMLKLLLGLYEPNKGEIKIDGHSLSEIDTDAWRKKIGVVMQDDQLLSGSIAQNISFFAPEQNLETIRGAAKMAHIHNEIMSMPMNYLSLIGDTGSAMSGGQKQRVLLARALYRDPSVLILDEGTANLDTNTERRIVDAIADLSATRIVIAHRPEFLERSDRVIRIDNGTIQ